MKFFERNDKFNWVDENNVVLGFNAYQSCCESFGSLYHTDPDQPEKTWIELTDTQLDEYEFDKEYYEYDKLPANDDGGSFTVRMHKKNDHANIVYLTIYNQHNGYYSHGFSFDNGGTTIHGGLL